MRSLCLIARRSIVIAVLCSFGCGLSTSPDSTADSQNTKSEAVKLNSKLAKPAEPVQQDVADTNTPVSLTKPSNAPPNPHPSTTGTSQPSARSQAAVRALIDAYSQQNPSAWMRAEQAVLSLGPEAVPALAQQLLNPNVFAREVAVMLLARMGEDSLEATSELVSALNDQSKLVRANAASILTLDDRQSSLVVPVLAQLLKDADVELRIMAATALGNVGVHAANVVPHLTAQLASGDERLRSAAANSLGEIGSSSGQSVPALTKLLDDKSSSVRTVAHEAIQRISIQSAD